MKGKIKKPYRILSVFITFMLLFFSAGITSFASGSSNTENTRSIIREVASEYNMDYFFVESIAWHESRLQQDAINYDGSCIGVMQVSTRWHSERANDLGVSIYDTYGNIKTGCDYLHELFIKYEDPALVLMIYNMGNKGLELYNEGVISDYAMSVLEKAEVLRYGVMTFE